MKKLFSIVALMFAFAITSQAQCTVNVLSAKVETNGGTGFEFKIQTDPNVNFYDVQLKKTNQVNWQTPDAFKCIGVRHYFSDANDTYTVSIPKDAAAAYGFVKGDDVRVVPHCGIITYQDCRSTSNMGTPSATYMLKFKGN